MAQLSELYPIPSPECEGSQRHTASQVVHNPVNHKQTRYPDPSLQPSPGGRGGQKRRVMLYNQAHS